MNDPAPVDVAVGVVIRDGGKVLLGQRPAGKPYAGWWEFPGGKLERGESVEHALARELEEELGLRIRGSFPWVIRQFVYPHATVRLHFRRVFELDGEPHGREGQAFAWRHPDAIDVAPLLPATVPVIAWLRLPQACALSAAAELGEPAFLGALARRLGEGRLRMLVLAEPRLAASRFEALFYPVAELCRGNGCRLLVDARHPASFARAAGGLLLSSDQLRRIDARPALPTVAVAADDGDALCRAAALGLDFAILDSRTEGDGGLVAATGLPVYVPDTLAAHRGVALRIGAQGVASGAAFWHD